MKNKLPKENNMIDPLAPWKLPCDDFGTSSITNYRMSTDDWDALLQKAEDGDPEAQWEIADRYHDGCKDESGSTLIEASPEKAVEWFSKSAKAGYAPAQNNLGVMLGDGDGVERDSDLAIHWLKAALKRGDSCAAQNIAITYRENGNFKRAFYWFKKCADNGDDEATLQLGIHYFWGKGVRKDYSKALYCLQKTIKSKNVSESSKDNANFYLALAYAEGKGVTKSITTAKKLLRRANRDNDHPAARKMLRELEMKS